MAVFVASLLPFFFLVGVMSWPYDPLTIHEIKVTNSPVTPGDQGTV